MTVEEAETNKVEHKESKESIGCRALIAHIVCKTVLAEALI